MRARAAAPRAAGSEELLQLLANPTNRSILSALAVEPQYPRRLASLVGLSENEASKRLRYLEKLGVVQGEWAHLGRTIRLYKLQKARFSVEVTGTGLAVAAAGGRERLVLGSAAEAPPVLPRIVGRVTELERLDAWLDEGRAVCVFGMGGSGKTALAATLASRKAVPLFWHTVAPGESGLLLIARLATAARIHAGPEAAQRLMLLNASDDGLILLDAVIETADRLGTLIVVDRFEVAGEGAVDVLNQLATRLKRARLIVTARSFPKGLSREHVQAVRLTGLSKREVQDLLESLGVATDMEFAEDVYERTLGHPLAVHLVALVAKQGRPETTQKLMEEAGIRDFLLRDVLPQLPDSERDVLMAASLVREPLSAQEAVTVSGNKYAATHLAQLENRGLLSRAGDTFRIHDLVRTFAGQAVPHAREIHARAARAFEESGEASKTLEAMWHYWHAAEIPEALRLLRQEAVNREFRFAELSLTERYEEVLRLLLGNATQRPPEAWIAAAELCTLMTLIGDADAARQYLEIAQLLLGRRRDPARAAARLAAARLLHLEGRLQDARSEFEACLRESSAVEFRRLHLDALLGLAFVVEESDLLASFRLFQQAVKAAQEGSDLRQLSLAYAGASRLGFRLGHRNARAWADEALRHARAGGYARGEAAVYMSLTVQAMAMKDDAMGLEFVGRYLEIASVLRDPWLTMCATHGSAMLAMERGHPEEALALEDKVIGFARNLRSPFYHLAGAILMGRAYLAVGQPASAAEVLQEALQSGEEEASGWPGLVASAWSCVADSKAKLGDRAAALQARRHMRQATAQQPVLGRDPQPKREAAKR